MNKIYWKLKRLIKHFGIEGYGIYFMLLNVLNEQPKYTYPLSDIDLLAEEFGTSEHKILSVINDFDLFINDNINFF